MRQIDQEIIQATDELKKDVQLTTDIVTGDENTVVEVAPGTTVRSPKKMIEDCYEETRQAIEQKFGSLDQAISDAGAEADRAEAASQSSSDSAGNSAESATAAANSAVAASLHKTAAEQAQAASEAAAADSEAAKTGSETAASESENHSINSGQYAAAALESQNAAKASEVASAESASDSLTHSQTSARHAGDSEASASASAAETAKAQQYVVDATAQADRAENEADRAEAAGLDSLKKASNLSDLANKATSRTNLDVYSKAEVDAELGDLDALPDQSGHGGQLLGTDGTNADWIEPPETLPYQTGNNGKFLQTDGTIATWQPAAISNPNLLINGDFSVDQRSTPDTWKADRWKVSGSNIIQVVEDKAFLKNQVYTLSYEDYASQVTSPSSGHWSISVPNTVTWVKLELGPVATPFIPDDPATNLAKCQRYYQEFLNNKSGFGLIFHISTSVSYGGYPCFYRQFAVPMRVQPSVTVYEWAGGDKMGAAGFVYKITGDTPVGQFKFEMAIDTEGFQLQPADVIWTPGLYWGYWKADAEL